MKVRGKVHRADGPGAATGILYGNELRRDHDKANGYFPRQYPKEVEKAGGRGYEYKMFPRDSRLDRIPQTDPDKLLYENRSAAYKCFNLDDRDPRKRRIPQTSVIHRVSDYRQCFVCGYTTAAKLINWANVWTAITMLVLLIVTVDVGFLRAGVLNTDLRVQRFNGGWNWTYHNETTLADLDKVWGLKDQNTPFSLSGLIVTILCIELFMTLFEITLGLFESTWYIYWRQFDDCFMWWRWIHWAVSDALLVCTLALIMGIREIGILGCFFVLIWTCYILGFVNELYSRPRFKEDTTLYAWPAGAIPEKEFKVNVEGQPRYKVNYDVDPYALKIISQDRWEGDRALYDDNFEPLEGSNELLEAQRIDNYYRRMLPHALGWVPGLTPWIIMTVTYFRHRLDLRDMLGNESVDYEDYRIILFFGSAILSWSKALVQIVFQYLPPAHYWVSELIAIVLNLALKSFFVILVLYNLVGNDVDTESALQRYQL